MEDTGDINPNSKEESNYKKSNISPCLSVLEEHINKWYSKSGPSELSEHECKILNQPPVGLNKIP